MVLLCGQTEREAEFKGDTIVLAELCKLDIKTRPRELKLCQPERKMRALCRGLVNLLANVRRGEEKEERR